MLFAVVIFLSVVVLGVIAALRFTKGIIPLRTYESRELPGFPGPAGLIHRLDGAEKRQRKLEKARFPEWMKTDSSAFLRHGKAR